MHSITTKNETRHISRYLDLMACADVSIVLYSSSSDDNVNERMFVEKRFDELNSSITNDSFLNFEEELPKVNQYTLREIGKHLTSEKKAFIIQSVLQKLLIFFRANCVVALVEAGERLSLSIVNAVGIYNSNMKLWYPARKEVKK